MLCGAIIHRVYYGRCTASVLTTSPSQFTYDPWVGGHLEQERTALLDSLSTIEEELRVVDSTGEGGVAVPREYYQERRLRELNLLRPLVGCHDLMIGMMMMMMMMRVMIRMIVMMMMHAINSIIIAVFSLCVRTLR